VIASGCDSDHGNGAGGRTLAGTKWRLTAWSVSSLDSSQFTITADFDDSQISGTSAVNSYGGPYTAGSDGTFSVGELRATRMAGSEVAMRAEAIDFDLLQQARNYAATETTLTLKNEGDQEILIFEVNETDSDTTER